MLLKNTLQPLRIESVGYLHYLTWQKILLEKTKNKLHGCYIHFVSCVWCFSWIWIKETTYVQILFFTRNEALYGYKEDQENEKE